MNQALIYLSDADPRMARLIELVELPVQAKRICDFDALTSSIVGQQLSGKAAAGIWRKVVEGLGVPEGERLTAAHLKGHTVASLRVFGLSGTKAASLLDVARHDVAWDELPGMSDAEVYDRLITIRGVGVWTIQMLLIFPLERPDVMPISDLGVRHGARILDGLTELPTAKALVLRSEVWAPHRSTAAKLLWRLKDSGIELGLPPVPTPEHYDEVAEEVTAVPTS